MCNKGHMESYADCGYTDRIVPLTQTFNAYLEPVYIDSEMCTNYSENIFNHSSPLKPVYGTRNNKGISFQPLHLFS